MAKIHGAVYLIIGIFISLVSYFSTNKSLRFFIYIGFLFGIIGIIKLLFTSLKKKKKEKPVQHTHYKHPKVSQKEQSLFTKYCQRCGNLVRTFDNFCSRCGQALLHRRR